MTRGPGNADHTLIARNRRPGRKTVKSGTGATVHGRRVTRTRNKRAGRRSGSRSNAS